MDITKYFIQAPDDHPDGRALNPDVPSTSSQICAERELNSLQEELSSKRKRQSIPEKIKKKLPIAHGNMESQKLASGAKENMLNTSLYEKLPGIGSLNVKLFVKKILHRLMHHQRSFLCLAEVGQPY